MRKLLLAVLVFGLVLSALSAEAGRRFVNRYIHCNPCVVQCYESQMNVCDTTSCAGHGPHGFVSHGAKPGGDAVGNGIAASGHETGNGRVLGELSNEYNLCLGQESHGYSLGGNDVGNNYAVRRISSGEYVFGSGHENGGRTTSGN